MWLMFANILLKEGSNVGVSGGSKEADWLQGAVSSGVSSFPPHFRPSVKHMEPIKPWESSTENMNIPRDSPQKKKNTLKLTWEEENVN